ncbi:craniofacial development protein 1-like [Macrosteles quadrilineatus]|uniref:craniofacial development protein 1-like n=1 Tax=Macrosteles quadrilineatus TaxID=74068 RepID=UPI0023E281E1|nr:craniofacial development protein 1-like [Macrosteles quadrilineatus]XP_054288266.1 craniofacial development protein 1-like [Macrosteles quadrilineatus]
MAEQRDLPSDSDESDVDFKPEDEESVSEEDSDGCVEEAPLEQEEDDAKIPGKRKKRQTKRRKKIKKKKADETVDEPEESEEVKKLSAEEEKKKADSLWNDFMKDCSPPVRKPEAPTNSKVEVKETKPVPTQPPVIEKENKALVVTEIFEFAGEKVTVEKELPAQGSGRGRGRGMVRGGMRGGVTQGRPGGLAAIVGQLGKKNKLSTLEKSKLDWDRFKKDEGIEAEIQTHNKGKEGYLERQDFLQRTDLRQFEIEKQLRTTSRSNR